MHMDNGTEPKAPRPKEYGYGFLFPIGKKPRLSDSWNICNDFFDELVNELDEWNRMPEYTREDIERLRLFGMGMTGVGFVNDVAAWNRAKVWLDFNVSSEFRKKFEQTVEGVRRAVDCFLRYLDQLPDSNEDAPESDSVADDYRPGEREFHCFKDEEIEPRLEYLRNVAAVVRQNLLGTVAPKNEPEPGTETLLGACSPAHRRAYLACSWVEMNVGTHVTDREAYDWLRDNGLPDERDEPQLAGEFEGYQLPPFPTWSRYVRCARKTLGQQKYSRRAGRSTGRTVLPERETEFLDWSQS